MGKIMYKDHEYGVLASNEYKKLLWTNNSTSDFAAQTISLDLTKYDCVEIWFYALTDVDPILTNVLTLEVGQKNRVTVIHSLGSAGVNENTGSRQAVVNSNGVVFSDYTYKNRRSGGTLTTANQFAIPYKIYGVKYERVNPPQVEIADCIVEQGMDGTWQYRKWANGRFEMWRVYSGVPTTGTHYVQINNFYGYRLSDINFPSSCTPINTNYHISAEWTVGSGFAMPAGTVGTKTTSKFSLYCVASAGSQTKVTINIYVTGRWK